MNPLEIAVLVACIIMMATMIFLSIRKRRTKDTWSQEWDEADLAGKERMFAQLPEPSNLEEEVALDFLHLDLKHLRAIAQDEAEAERLGVPVAELDRALLIEKAQKLNIVVRPEDTKKTLKYKVNRYHERAKHHELEADLPPLSGAGA